MASRLLSTLFALAVAVPAWAAVPSFPKEFRSQKIANGDVTLHVRSGGHGPAIVLLHGFGDTGDMWAALASALAKDHTVVVPDLRGMGLSSHAASDYTKKTQAGDVRAALKSLGIEHAVVIGHDIGTMVAFAQGCGAPGRGSRADLPRPVLERLRG